uniref:Uncharacterized protein n=1 Tax=Zea mays TaxID=4577 RepID=C4J3F0_MAIZE|nr:unknown [Zea mays]
MFKRWTPAAESSSSKPIRSFFIFKGGYIAQGVAGSSQRRERNMLMISHEIQLVELWQQLCKNKCVSAPFFSASSLLLISYSHKTEGMRTPPIKHNHLKVR